jgi:sugar phosphate isomerase/epimerase
VEIEKFRKWLDVTERLGSSHLRVFGGMLPSGATLEQGVQWAAETLKPACDQAFERGITLGIEDDGGITTFASAMIEIVRRVASPALGINLDISNFTADQYAQIQSCLPYATNAHIRDFFERSGELIDLPRVWQMFAGAGYEGYMCCEYEGKEDSMTAVPKLVERIKTLCTKYSTV